MKSNDLAGKVAIVTGASRGIGRRIALTLAENGARIALAARTAGDLEAVRAEIEALGGGAAALTTDVSQEDEVVSLVERTLARFGRLDIVVNNAGIGVLAPLAETTAEQWDGSMAVNARGPFLLCREAIAHLGRQERSFIVNVVSVVGVKGYAHQAAYSASKHALLGMTKALAKEVQKAGIRVHAICPGGVDTPMMRELRPDLDAAQLIRPQAIADAVLFLVTRSDNAVIDEIHVRRESSLPWA